MKTLLVALVAFIAAGCSDSAAPMIFSAAPPELADCKFYKLSNKNGQHISVVRCPNSITTSTYSIGKSTVSTVVIDGVEYVKKENK